MLERVLEPEVMDTPAEAVEYDRMDHSEVNRRFVDDFLSALAGATLPQPPCWQIFDAGTGTALIPIELLQRGLDAKVTASDLAEEMLVVARQNVLAKGLEGSIRIVHGDCKQLLDADRTYDAVMSNSIVHHIPQPEQVLRELWRILKPGGLLFIRDLVRPQNNVALDQLVQTYAGTANPHQQKMFRESLQAALTMAEVCELVRRIGLGSDVVRLTSDRHWTIQGQKPT